MIWFMYWRNEKVTLENFYTYLLGDGVRLKEIDNHLIPISSIQGIWLYVYDMYMFSVSRSLYEHHLGTLKQTNSIYTQVIPLSFVFLQWFNFIYCFLIWMECLCWNIWKYGKHECLCWNIWKCGKHTASAPGSGGSDFFYLELQLKIESFEPSFALIFYFTLIESEKTGCNQLIKCCFSIFYDDNDFE